MAKLKIRNAADLKAEPKKSSPNLGEDLGGVKTVSNSPEKLNSKNFY